MDQSDYPQKFIVKGIIDDIRRLFNSLHKRYKIQNTLTLQGWRNYREDGFESMFFTDLIHWLSNRLLTRDIKKTETAEEIQKWINYCQAVSQSVFTFRNERPLHYDAKYRLESIIDSLQRLHDNVNKCASASTFNDKIHQINMTFIETTNDTYDFLYLLLADVPTDRILVKLLLAYPLNNTVQEPKFKKIVNSLMGQWLISSLNRAGIKDNDFELTTLTNMEDINHYLITNTADITDLNTTGLWDFAQHRAYKIVMSNALYPVLLMSDNTLYIRQVNDEIHYTVKSPRKEACRGRIPLKSLGLNHGEIIDQKQLESKINYILTITGNANHTYYPNSNAESYLEQVIEIHRSLQRLFDVRQLIVLGAKVATGWGHAWVYGEDTGAVHIENLILVINNAFNDLHSKLNNFWRNYYTNDFKKYHDTNDKTPCYQKTVQITSIISRFEQRQISLQKCLKFFKTDVDNPQYKDEYIQMCLDQLDYNIEMYSQWH